MPRNRSDNGQNANQTDASQMDNSNGAHQAELMSDPTQDYSAEPETFTATTSPEVLAEEVSEVIVQDLLSFKEQVWSLVGKKLRAQMGSSGIIAYPQCSLSDSQDGLLLDISSSAEPLPPLPHDATS